MTHTPPPTHLMQGGLHGASIEPNRLLDLARAGHMGAAVDGVGSTSTQQGWDRRCVAQDSGAAGEGAVHEVRGRVQQKESYPTMGHSRSVSVATILLHQRVTSLMAGAGTGKQTNKQGCMCTCARARTWIMLPLPHHIAELCPHTPPSLPRACTRTQRFSHTRSKKQTRSLEHRVAGIPAWSDMPPPSSCPSANTPPSPPSPTAAPAPAMTL
jgi:hypothetical protein